MQHRQDGPSVVDQPPVSVDLTLGNKLRVFRSERYYLIDVKQEMPNLTEVVEIDELNPFILHPGAFVLGMTGEWVRLPADLMGRLDGKSSLGLSLIHI